MKITAVLHEVGDRVKIAVGDFKGSAGVVIGHGHVGSRDTGSGATASPDVVHFVKLDKPVPYKAKKETDHGNGKTTTETEDVTIDAAEVPASGLIVDQPGG